MRYKPAVMRAPGTQNEQNHSSSVRDARRLGQKIHDGLVSPTAGAALIVCAGATALVLPGMVEICLLFGLFYARWILKQKQRLPFKLPSTSKMLDWGELKPGTQKPSDAGGIFFCGNDRDTGEELWLTSSDIRTHTLVLGTTGSGKTELLVSVSANALNWSSGFIYIDGKADTSLWGKIYSLARRYGRDDDLLIINFMKGGKRGRGESNTMNPFADGSDSTLFELLSSLMDDGASGSDMWKGRAQGLMSVMITSLVELRDKGLLLLDVEKIREYLPLTKIIELHEKAEQGILSEQTGRSLKAYLESLAGFNWEEAKSKPLKFKSSTVLEQHGYLTMQWTNLLGNLADVYGYIFKAPLAEISLEDVVLNRRMLVCMLPTLEKSEDSIAALGKVVVAAMKNMMGKSLGSKLSGSKREVLDNKPTNSKAPYVVVLDEVGYYTVPGLAASAAQGRSLGFAIYFAAQDISAMKKRGGVVEKEVGAIIANCNTVMIGKTVDAGETLDLIEKMGGQGVYLETTGLSAENGSGNTYMDTKNAKYEIKNRVNPLDLKAQKMGQFTVLSEDKLVRANTYFANPKLVGQYQLGRMIRIRYPRQTEENNRKLARVADIAGRLSDPAYSAAGQSVPAKTLVSELAGIFKAPCDLSQTERAAAAMAYTAFAAARAAGDGPKKKPASDSNSQPSALDYEQARIAFGDDSAISALLGDNPGSFGNNLGADTSDIFAEKDGLFSGQDATQGSARGSGGAFDRWDADGEDDMPSGVIDFPWESAEEDDDLDFDANAVLGDSAEFSDEIADVDTDAMLDQSIALGRKAGTVDLHGFGEGAAELLADIDLGDGQSWHSEPEEADEPAPDWDGGR